MTTKPTDESREADLHACEVRSVIRRFWPDGYAAAEYMANVEKRRGKAAADNLREDCRVAWKAHRFGVVVET